ncbi:MAG: tetratricopeptide repeat protein [Bdellovibrionales bacterium]
MLKARAPLFQALLLFVLVLIGYWPALHGQFIWDDITFISENDLVRSPNGLFNIWFTKDSTDYWPLTYSIFWFLWRAFGPATLGYHILNILIHSLNALLVWKILSRMGMRWAYVAALIFAVHPVAVESVAWIFQLKTILAATFALGSLWFWIRFYEGSRKSYEISLALLVCALLTKTSIVTWPLVLLGYVLWKNRKLARKDWFLIAPFMFVSFLAGSVGFFWYSYDQLLGGERVRIETFIERVASAGYAFWFYICKAFIPFNLIFMYPRWQIDPQNILDFIPVALLVLVFAAAIWRRSNVIYALGFIFLTVFPVLGFVDIYYMRFSYVADHWQYLTLIGSICIFAAVTAQAGRWIYAVIPVLLFLTFQQSSHYVDEESIWRNTLAKNPQAWLAENGLGVILMQTGKRDEAVTHFQNLIHSTPDYVDPYLNMGVIYLGQSEDATASEYFLKALKVFPHNARALNNMAALALRHGEPAVALHYLHEAVEYLPTYSMGYKNLGIVYLRLNQRAEAAEAFQKALHLRSDDEEAHKYLESLGAISPNG